MTAEAPRMQTVFISSTFKDLVEHRRAAWDCLTTFKLSIKGMENFGARTGGPLDTCLAELEQSDVYVGIIAFRIGTLDPASQKSFTQIEYEQARKLRKEVLIYIASEERGVVPYSSIDRSSIDQARLDSFKNTLREMHTIETFSSPDDLADKLARDIGKYFAPSDAEPSGLTKEDAQFSRSVEVLKRLWLTPKIMNGRTIRIIVEFRGNPFPASRLLCEKFNLAYGNTVGVRVGVTRPDEKHLAGGFDHIFATGVRVDELLGLIESKSSDISARLQFSPDDIPNVHAEFAGRMDYDYDEEPDDPRKIWVRPEGRIILLFSGEWA